MELHAVGAVDSVTVEIRAEGALVASRRVAVPARGLTTTGQIPRAGADRLERSGPLHRHGPHGRGTLGARTAATAWIAVALVVSSDAVAQPPDPPPAEGAALREAIVERFELLPLSDSVGLAPREADAGVRLIELQNGAIAIDGVVVSGQELRERIGPDADLIVRLSYLDDDVVRAMFDTGTTSDAVNPEVERPEPPVSPVPPASQPPPPPVARERRTGRSDIVRIGGPVTVGADERVRGDIVVIGGPLVVDGEVTGDIVCVGGPATFGPQAEVRGEVTIVGGPIHRAPTAELGGGVNEIGLGDFELFENIDWGEWAGAGWWGGLSRVFGPQWRWGGWDLAGTVLRLVLLALLACVVVFAAEGTVMRAAERSAVEPVKAGLVGLLAQLLMAPLFVVTVVLLLVSVIGIPLLVLMPFAVLAVFVLMLVGFAGAAHALGTVDPDPFRAGDTPRLPHGLGRGRVDTRPHDDRRGLRHPGRALRYRRGDAGADRRPHRVRGLDRRLRRVDPQPVRATPVAVRWRV